MKTSLKVSFLISLGLLISCGNEDLFAIRGMNSAWTPQYTSIVQYNGMMNAVFYDGTNFAPDLGDPGEVKNPNGTGMSAVNGTVNMAIEFDGVDDRVIFPYAIYRNPLAFSVSAWVRLDSFNSRGCIVTSRDESPARGYALCVNSTSQPEALLGRGGSAGNWTTATGTSILNNSWTHLVMTYDGTNLRLYKNGNLEASPLSAFAQNIMRPMYFGAGGTELTPAASDFFKGQIDEITIWTSVLSAADVEAIFIKQSR